jgi:hypothetical protein
MDCAAGVASLCLVAPFGLRFSHRVAIRCFQSMALPVIHELSPIARAGAPLRSVAEADRKSPSTALGMNTHMSGWP